MGCEENRTEFSLCQVEMILSFFSPKDTTVLPAESCLYEKKRWGNINFLIRWLLSSFFNLFKKYDKELDLYYDYWYPVK